MTAHRNSNEARLGLESLQRPKVAAGGPDPVAAGDAVLSPRITKRLLEQYAQQLPLPSADRAQIRRPPRLASLTEREFDVLPPVARGLPNARIDPTAGHFELGTDEPA